MFCLSVSIVNVHIRREKNWYWTHAFKAFPFAIDINRKFPSRLWLYNNISLFHGDKIECTIAHELDRFCWSVEIYCHAVTFWLTSSWYGFFFSAQKFTIDNLIEINYFLTSTTYRFMRIYMEILPFEICWRWKNKIVSAFDLILHSAVAHIYYIHIIHSSDSNQPKLHICIM